jgi:hypothetical protein
MKKPVSPGLWITSEYKQRTACFALPLRTKRVESCNVELVA